MLLVSLLTLSAYLIGSIPFGWIVGAINGVNIRDVGSGNIGATNVARGLGKRWAACVLMLDLLKGLLPVLVCSRWLESSPLHSVGIVSLIIAPVVGHVFPVWLKFRGGKGVATGLGVALAVCPWAALVGGVAYGMTVLFTRTSSLGSLAGVLAALLAMLWFAPSLEIISALIVVVALIFIRHRSNIERLLNGMEHKF